MSASEYINRRKSDAIVKSGLFSDKVKHPLQASILAFLKRVSGPLGYPKSVNGKLFCAGVYTGAPMVGVGSLCLASQSVGEGTLNNDGSFISSDGFISPVYRTYLAQNVYAIGSPINIAEASIFYNCSRTTYRTTFGDQNCTYTVTFAPGTYQIFSSGSYTFTIYVPPVVLSKVVSTPTLSAAIANPLYVAFNSGSQKLYASTQSEIYSIDGVTVTNITNYLDDFPGVNIRALAYSTGLLFIVDLSNDGRILQVDTGTGVASQIGTGNYRGVAASFEASPVAYVISETDVYDITNSVSIVEIPSPFTNLLAISIDDKNAIFVADSNGVDTLIYRTNSGFSSSPTPFATISDVSSINGMVVAKTGYIYVTVSTGIYEIDIDGTVTLFAGSKLVSGNTNGELLVARFNGATGITSYSDDNLYIADSNNSIRLIS